MIAARNPVPAEPEVILYTNHRGETAVRRIRLDVIAHGNEAVGFGFGSTEWHPGEQLLFSAFDVDKGARRTFAMAGVKAWGQPQVEAALAFRDALPAQAVAAPAPGTEERELWLEAAEQHGFESTTGEETLPAFDPPAYLATKDEVLKLMAAGREQGRKDVLDALATALVAREGDAERKAMSAAADVGNLRVLAEVMCAGFEGATLSVETTELVGAALNRLYPGGIHTRERCKVCDYPEDGGCDECPTEAMLATAEDKLAAWVAQHLPGLSATTAETFESIAAWAETTFGPITPERTVARADEEMVELRAEPGSVEEAADVVICLARYANLWAAVERKMAVNRKRQWRRVGDGTGYHIKATQTPPFRAGDHVLHGPSGETWVVAWADPVTGDLAWCGWPDGVARISDCTLAKAASDAEHQQKLRELKASGGSRAAKALRLYGEPAEA